MNKFATGMLLGGAAAMAGMGYLMKDKRTYQRPVSYTHLTLPTKA